MVSHYYGNNMPGGLAFTDRVYGNTFHWSYQNGALPHLSYVAGSPDIIVGNSATNPGNEYKVAAAYILRRGVFPTITFSYQVDYFTVTYTGPGTFVVTHTGGTAWPPSPIMDPRTIHLDIIAEAGNTGITGLPWCDKFVITWDDKSIYAWQGSLNGPLPGSLSNTAPGVRAIAGGTYYRPDVAAVQKQTCSTCPVEDVAIITYLGEVGGALLNLHIDEWNITVGPVITNPIWWTDPSGAGIEWPRIDAPDDYNINSGAGTSNFKVTAHAANTLSYTFDNLLGPGVFWDNATPFVPGWKGAPTVAFGGAANTQYAVAHYNNTTSWTGDVYMEPIDWTNPTALALSPSFASNWFRVNTSPVGFINGVFLTAISTPCNNPAANTLISWSWYDNATNLSYVHYKVSGYGPPNGYAFRPTAVADAAPTPFSVYPNPATTGITTTATAGTAYSITDMLGMQVLSGTLSSGSQYIYIGELPPGNYIVTANGKQQKLVKN
jgi:hypothetical protein